MSKRNRLKKHVEAAQPVAAAAPAEGLKLGPHQFPAFDGPAAVFGANERDYPAMHIIPEQFKSFSGPYQNVFSGLFYNGGKLDDFGLTVKAGINRAQFFTALRALMCSWAPKHEHKTATVAWALSEWCDGTPKAGA